MSRQSVGAGLALGELDGDELGEVLGCGLRVGDVVGSKVSPSRGGSGW